MDRVLALIVDEGKWLPFAMSVALLSVAALLYRHRALDVRRRVTAAMNLFFGVMIGTMAFGHMLAVTTKLAQGTLRGGTAYVPLFYVIGIVLAAPSFFLVRHALRLPAANAEQGRRTLGLNAWLALTLLALGLHNFPLAAPGLFNAGYELHSRRAVGWAIVSLAVAANVGLFIASLVFLASGQTFEELRRIR